MNTPDAVRSVGASLSSAAFPPLAPGTELECVNPNKFEQIAEGIDLMQKVIEHLIMSGENPAYSPLDYLGDENRRYFVVSTWRRLRREGALGLLLRENDTGRVVAMGNIFPQKRADAWQLDTVYVDPDCQGRGLGRTLIGILLTHARTNGASRVDLLTDTYAHAAIHLYEQFGFKEIARFDDGNVGYRLVLPTKES